MSLALRGKHYLLLLEAHILLHKIRGSLIIVSEWEDLAPLFQALEQEHKERRCALFVSLLVGEYVVSLGAHILLSVPLLVVLSQDHQSLHKLLVHVLVELPVALMKTLVQQTKGQQLLGRGVRLALNSLLHHIHDRLLKLSILRKMNGFKNQESNICLCDYWEMMVVICSYIFLDSSAA